MSPLFASRDHAGHTRALWRVDAAGVAVMIISESGHVYYYDHSPIMLFTLDTRHRYDQFIDRAERCMADMARIAVQNFSGAIHESVIVLGEPWAHTIRQHLIYKRKTPFKLTFSFVNKLVDRDMKRIQKQYQKSGHNIVKLLAPTYHDVLIAGHSVPDPWGKMVHDFRLDYSTGFFDTEIADRLLRIVHERMKIPMRNIHIEHYQNMLMRFWRHVSLGNSLLIDCNGFVSDMYIFQNHILMQVGTIPMGMVDIHNQLAIDIRITGDELDSLLSLYAKNLLDDRSVYKLNHHLEKFYRIWEADLQRFCNTAVEQGDIIEQIVWIGDETNKIMEYFMQQLRGDAVKFPIVFGSAKPGFMHVDALLNNMPQGLQNQDQIILAGIL